MRTQKRLLMLGLTMGVAIPIVITADECSTALGCHNSAPGDGATAMGEYSTASGDYSTAVGYNSTASGFGASALGYITQANGSLSTATGIYTRADGDRSTAMGYQSEADGYGATAIGSGTSANGYAATAMGAFTSAAGYAATASGYGTRANAYDDFAMGRYNVGNGTPDVWVAEDPLFEIGNGALSTNRSNAFTVLKKGYTGIRTASPEYPLQITYASGDDVEPGSGGNLVIGSADGKNLAMDRNEIMARNAGGTSALYLQNNGGDLYVGGQIYQSSDARLKDHIEALPYGLREAKLLRPVSYYWNTSQLAHRGIGLVAQEVERIVPEIVQNRGESGGYLSVDYTGINALLVNAVKEHKSRNDALAASIRNQSDDLAVEIDGLSQALDAQTRIADAQRREIESLQKRSSDQRRRIESIVAVSSRSAAAKRNNLARGSRLPERRISR